MKLFEVCPNVFFFNFVILLYGTNSSSKCKMYILFVLFGIARAKWSTYLSISFFIKCFHPNVMVSGSLLIMTVRNSEERLYIFILNLLLSWMLLNISKYFKGLMLVASKLCSNRLKSCDSFPQCISTVSTKFILTLFVELKLKVSYY